MRWSRSLHCSRAASLALSFVVVQDMSTTAIAQLLGNTLYYKRFFPYYCFNVLAGLDADGAGAVYGYDAIGSFERIPYGVTGSGSALITSILDNQVAFKTHMKNYRELSAEECLDLVKDVMTSAGERDIYTGDSVDIVIITKDGMKEEKFELKKD
jgi:20S proteasome subunit beta 6